MIRLRPAGAPGRTAAAFGLPLALAAAALGPGATAALAQEDFLASEPDRPLRVEDAYPVKYREWETEAGLRGVVGEGPERASARLELKTGLLPNAQVGIEALLGLEGGGGRPGGTEAGLEEVGVHLLYNFNRETWSWPAFAVRVDAHAPGAGGVSREAWSAAVKGIATRSVGRLRLHGNAGYAAAANADGGDHWAFGLGFDYPIGLFSRAVLGDIFVEVPRDAGRTRVWAGAGTRWQVTNRSVLDAGLATRLDEWERGAPNLEITVGVSRVFGIPALVRVPPWPDPSIR